MKRSRRSQFLEIAAVLRTLPSLLLQTDPRLSVAIIALQALQALVPLAQLWLLRLIIDQVVVESRLHATSMGYISRLVAIEVGLTIGGLALREAVQVIRVVLAERVTAFMSVMILSRTQELDLQTIEQPDFLDRLRRAEEAAFYRPANLLVQLLAIMQGSILLAGIAVLLIRVQPLALPVLVLAALPYAFVQSGAATTLYTLATGQTRQTRMARYFSHLLSSDTVAKEVRIFRLRTYLLTRYRAILATHERDIRAAAVRRGVRSTAASFVPASVLGLLFAYLTWQALHHEVAIGDLTLYMGLMLQGQSAMQQLTFNGSSMVENSLFLADYRALAGFQPSTEHVPTARVPAPFTLSHGVKFEGVTFRYKGKDVAALENVSIELPAGQTVAIVGENGAGKTTLVKLLARLYEPDAGRITIDGIDIHTLDEEQWRERIAVIFQDFVHFLLTARENVGFGSIDFIDDHKRIVSAASYSGAHDVIAQLPGGYESYLGRGFETGTELSGGEWQRIALARAFMRDAPLLILDEPTAALDARAEHETFERLRDLARGRTVLIISHRFSTVRMADRIYVLDAGSVIESGSHAELMERRGRYAELFKLQAAAYQ